MLKMNRACFAMSASGISIDFTYTRLNQAPAPIHALCVAIMIWSFRNEFCCLETLLLSLQVSSACRRVASINTTCSRHCAFRFKHFHKMPHLYNVSHSLFLVYLKNKMPLMNARTLQEFLQDSIFLSSIRVSAHAQATANDSDGT